MGSKEKILELFEINGRINGLKYKSRETAIKISNKNSEIEKERNRKAQLLTEKDNASNEVKDARVKVESINERILALKKELTAAKKIQTQANQKLLSYSEEVMADPDKVIATLVSELEAFENEKKELNDSIAKEKESYNTLNDELKESGIELNIKQTEEIPTTTYL